MKNHIFTGAATAIVTPLTKDGIDYEQFARLIEWQISEGVQAIVAVGTTGEGSTLSDAEHKEAKDASVFTKMSAKVGSVMNTMMDSTPSHIAEMVIEGSTMGITDSMRILHELQRSSCTDDPNYEEACRLSAGIVSFEEKQIGKMKKYL